MEPLISILTPAYNAASTIAATVNSALRQYWARKEIIIVDDGSNDNTLAIARQFQSHDVKVIAQEHLGAPSARNTAYAAAQGDYIQWLDADDLLAPDKISEQMQVISAGAGPRTLLSAAWGTFAYRPRRARFRQTVLWEDLAPHDWMARSMAHNAWMQTSVWLISRELSELAGPWDTRLLVDQDGEYIFRVLPESDSVKFVPTSRVYYRRLHDGGVSSASSECAKLESYSTSMHLHVQGLLRMEDSQRCREAAVRYLQSGSIRFVPERMDLFTGLKRLAESFGGTVFEPRLPRKYRWLQSTVGFANAKKLMLFLRALRASAGTYWDWFLSCFDFPSDTFGSPDRPHPQRRISDLRTV